MNLLFWCVLPSKLAGILIQLLGTQDFECLWRIGMGKQSFKE